MLWYLYFNLFDILRNIYFENLFYLPLHKPSFIECDTDIETEVILGNQILCRRTNPLSRYVKKRTVVICVNNRNSKSGTDAVLFRSILIFHLNIWCSI